MVHSGNRKNWGTGDVTNHRFVASDSDSWVSVLPEDGVAIRITKGDLTEHKRPFLEASRYQNIGITKVMRSDDGSGFFIMVDGAAAVLQPGEYRLVVTCNQEQELVVAEEDSDEPRIVILYLPWSAS